MPYKSKAQARKFRVMEAKGEIPKGTSSRWAAHTPDIKKLPEHVKESIAVFGLPRESVVDRVARRLTLPIVKEAGEEGAGGPPNYRMAAGDPKTCQTCDSYQGDLTGGLCIKYGTPVDQNYTCDEWSMKTMHFPSPPAISDGLGKFSSLREMAAKDPAVQALMKKANYHLGPQHMPAPQPTAAAGVKTPQAQPLVAPTTAQQIGMGNPVSPHQTMQAAATHAAPGPVPSTNQEVMSKMSFADRVVARLEKKAWRPMMQQPIWSQPGMHPAYNPGVARQMQPGYPGWNQLVGMAPQAPVMYSQPPLFNNVPGGPASVYGLAGMRGMQGMGGYGQQQEHDVEGQLNQTRDSVVYLQQIAQQYPPNHPWGREARSRLQQAQQHVQRLEAVHNAQQQRRQELQSRLERANPNPFAQPEQPPALPPNPAAAAAAQSPSDTDRHLHSYLQESERLSNAFLAGRGDEDRQRHMAGLGDSTTLAEMQRTNPALYARLRDKFLEDQTNAYVQARQQNLMQQPTNHPINTLGDSFRNIAGMGLAGIAPQLANGLLGAPGDRMAPVQALPEEELRRRGRSENERAFGAAGNMTLSQFQNQYGRVANWLPQFRLEHEQAYKSPAQRASEANPAWATATPAQREQILQQAQRQTPTMSDQDFAASPSFQAMTPEQRAQIQAHIQNQSQRAAWMSQYNRRYGSAARPLAGVPAAAPAAPAAAAPTTSGPAMAGAATTGGVSSPQNPPRPAGSPATPPAAPAPVAGATPASPPPSAPATAPGVATATPPTLPPPPVTGS